MSFSPSDVSLELPLVSVVIPAYKVEFFEAALSSAIGQAYPNLEIIICDDSAGPGIAAIVEAVRAGTARPIHYSRNDKKLGELWGKIKGIKLAQGEYIKLLHDDDILTPGCVSALVTALHHTPGAVMASSRRTLIDERSEPLPDVLATSFPFTMDVCVDGKELVSFLGEHTINFIGEPSCVLMRRQDLLAIGNDLMSLEGKIIHWVGDLALYVKLLRQGNLVFLAAPLTRFRVSSHQFSQAGRDRPGIGNQGHKDFRAALERLGWCRPEGENRYVRAAPLSDLAAWEPVDVMGGLRQAYEHSSTQYRLRHWSSARVLSPAQATQVRDHVAAAEALPTLGIVVRAAHPDAMDLLERTLASLPASTQATLPTRLLLPAFAPASADALGYAVDRLAFDASQATSMLALNAMLADWPVDWVLFVDAGDVFLTSGMTVLGLNLTGASGFRAVFTDVFLRESAHAPDRLVPNFRPDFNLDLLLSQPGVMARHWVFRRDALVAVGGLDTAYPQAAELDLILRLVMSGGMHDFGHLPEPLLTAHAVIGQGCADEAQVTLRHLAERGYPDAKVSPMQGGRYRVDYGHAHAPLVSIVIPAQDDLIALQTCIIGLMESTRYLHYELVIGVHADHPAPTRQWLAAVAEVDSARIRVVTQAQRVTRAALVNATAAHAQGEFVLLIRPDVGVMQKDWIEALLNHALRPEVGIVGAKTVSRGQLVTHAGLVPGLKQVAGRVFFGEPASSEGYLGRLATDQNYSAVADSCLMVRRELFEALGGFDAQAFPEYGADMDFCLRSAQQGYLTVWTPHATLVHDIVPDPLPADAERALYTRWLPAVANDRAYNRHFQLDDTRGYRMVRDPEILWQPLIWKPGPTVLAHPADTFGCGNYRVIRPMQALKEAALVQGGTSWQVFEPPELERIRPDAVVFQRQVTPQSIEMLRRTHAFSQTFKIFELDDYLPGLPVKSAFRATMPQDIRRSLRQALSYMDRFLVSTQPLADALKDFHPHFHVVRNLLAPRWWGPEVLPASRRRASARPRVGWAGGGGHTGDLALIADVVKALAGEVDWVFFGMLPPGCEGLVKEHHASVSIERYPAALARLNLDLALAPLEDNLFNACKSNVRLLEYGACGYPVICSDLVCYQGTLPVTRVKNRFHAWVDAIRMHVSDMDASAAAGDALRREIHASWMLAGDGLLEWQAAWRPSA